MVLLFFVAVPYLSQAQVTHGTLSYTLTKKAELDIPDGPHREAVAKALAELQSGGGMDERYELTFTPEAFTFAEQALDDRSFNDGDRKVTVIRSPGPKATYYTHTGEGRYVNSQPVADKLFLHSGPAEEIDWELTEHRIAPSTQTCGLALKVATAVSAVGDTLTAAYAPALPVDFGPENYHGLPGGIIQLSVKNGEAEKVYTASNLRPGKEYATVEPPVKGKEVSSERFAELKRKVNARTER